MFILLSSKYFLFHENVFCIFLIGAIIGFSMNSISLLVALFSHSQVNGKC